MKNINYTNCYCLALVFLSLITVMITIKVAMVQDDRINDLENQINEIKKEVISHDYQSEMIQLHH